MSADYGTKSFKGYHHKGYVYVVWKDEGETPFGAFTPELVSELQSLIDQWKDNSSDAE